MITYTNNNDTEGTQMNPLSMSVGYFPVFCRPYMVAMPRMRHVEETELFVH